MENIKIGIADDHRLFREGIRMLISEMPGITLCLEAEGGEDLLVQLQDISPDIVLLDIEMKEINGIETLKKILQLKSRPKVIVLSMHSEPRMISYMMELEANGYLPKDTKKEELENAIRTVFEKGTYFSEQVNNSILEGLRSRNKRKNLTIHLSKREKEVLTLICQEHTTEEIGEKLFISERTVEGHRKNLCEKLKVRNTAGLVKKAITLNLIEL